MPSAVYATRLAWKPFPVVVIVPWLRAYTVSSAPACRELASMPRAPRPDVVTVAPSWLTAWAELYSEKT